MPTDHEIATGIRGNARLEVAQNLKAVFPTLKAKLKQPIAGTPSDEDYLRMADELISKKREMHFGGQTVTINEMDDLIDTDKSLNVIKSFLNNQKLSQWIPKEEQLAKVAQVAQQSVKKATGPMTVMGTSLFTLITAFFQAIGDLFSGKVQGGFFAHVKGIAATRTGNEVARNMESGLTTLATQNPDMTWLTPSAIKDAGVAARHQARVAGGLEAPGPKDMEVMAKVDPTQSKQLAGILIRDVSGKIELGVRKELSGVVQTTLGAGEATGTFSSIINGAKEMTGFKASQEDADKITRTVANRISKVVGDPGYNYEGNNPVLKTKLAGGKPVSGLSKEELQLLLQEETKNALEAENKGGLLSLSFKLNDAHIRTITKAVGDYAGDGKNYEMLKGANILVRSAPELKLPPIGEKISIDVKKADEKHVAALEKTLGEAFEAKPEKSLISVLEKVGKKPLTTDQLAVVVKARTLFAQKAATIIDNNPRLLEKGKEDELAKVVMIKMMEDEEFKTQVTKILPKGMTWENLTDLSPAAAISLKQEIFSDITIRAQLIQDVGGPDAVDKAVAARKAAPAQVAVADATPAMPSLSIPLLQPLKNAFGFGDNKTVLDVATGNGKADAGKRESTLRDMAQAIGESGAVCGEKHPGGVLELKDGALRLKGNALDDPEGACRFAGNLIGEKLKQMGGIAEGAIDGIAGKSALELVNQALENEGRPRISEKTTPENVTAATHFNLAAPVFAKATAPAATQGIS